MNDRVTHLLSQIQLSWLPNHTAKLPNILPNSLSETMFDCVLRRMKGRKGREDEDGRWRRRNEDVKERGGRKEERREEGEGTIFLPASASLPSPLLSFYSPSGKIVPQHRRNYTLQGCCSLCYLHL